MSQPNRFFRGIRRSELSVLKPGGKLAALVWSAPVRNPLTSVPLALLEKYTGASFLGAAGPFALANPAHFEQVLKEAGFHEVTIQAIPVRFQFPSLEAFMLQGRRTVEGMMERLSQQEQERLAQDIRQALRQFEGPQGLVAPGEVLLGVGTKADSRRSSGS
jgi:hypothetical protein